EASLPQGFYPADRPVPPPDAKLSRRPLRIEWIERCLQGCPNSLRVVRMDALQHLLDRRLMVGKIENFPTAHVSRDDVLEGIILPGPELGGIEGKLKAIFASFQVLLRLFAGVDILDHRHVAQRPSEIVADNVHGRACPDGLTVLADIALLH